MTGTLLMHPAAHSAWQTILLQTCACRRAHTGAWCMSIPNLNMRHAAHPYPLPPPRPLLPISPRPTHTRPPFPFLEFLGTVGRPLARRVLRAFRITRRSSDFCFVLDQCSPRITEGEYRVRAA